MGRTFFVEPDTVRLPLYDDGAHWIDVKQQLNAGEARRLVQGAFSRVSQTGTLEDPSMAFDLNLEAAAFNKVALYLVDWNVPDRHGKTVEIATPKAKTDALKALHPAAFAEIERVIDEHALRQEKKQMTGTPSSSTIS